MTPMVILVDSDMQWWICELVNGTLEGDLKKVEKFPDELKDAWTPSFISLVERTAPQIIFFDEEQRTCIKPLTNVKVS